MNIVILSIGRSGSTILAKMLGAIGWNLGDADEEYAEHVRFRTLNHRLLQGGKVLPQEAAGVVQCLDDPWVLKDPRLTTTWPHWQPHLDLGGNLLLWLTRDLPAIEKSLRAKRWGKDSPRGLLLRGWTLQEHEAECRRCFEAWTGPKAEIAYENLHKAIALFDPTRGIRQ